MSKESWVLRGCYRNDWVEIVESEMTRGESVFLSLKLEVLEGHVTDG